MAQITITIPDNRVPRVLDAFARRHSFDPASGLTKAQFAKQVLIDIIVNVVVEDEAEQAANAAGATAEAKARQEITIT